MLRAADLNKLINKLVELQVPRSLKISEGINLIKITVIYYRFFEIEIRIKPYYATVETNFTKEVYYCHSVRAIIKAVQKEMRP